ncbi:hypothetical protein [Marinobacterium rhizophilum]|uniref:Solute:sodium symporter small subunit n=1 Tax=Marinobacterium rhizophilum TaxID=420402 RepID=A0ABY5HQZ2_9GAMM|nr:hypothetical protein [Marinobacterium rhizophilum]UTW13637.1 hypothetical protein KDW95_08365 [Marinobacterium rhizophilum]
MTPANKKLLHHIATALGLVFLGLWYLLFKQLGALDWVISLVPSSHAGAGLMLGIAIVMIPGFFIWKLYNRWVERRLDIRGRYYEDSYYRPDPDKDD